MSNSSVLHVGLDPTSKQLIEATFQGISLQEVSFDLDVIMTLTDIHPTMVVCGAPPENISVLEVAQILRGQFSGAQILLITSTSVQHSKRDLIKNGFNDIYYLPMDLGQLEGDLKMARELMGQLGLNLVSVKAHDLMDLDNLDFDTYIYLPSNGRYVPFSRAAGFTQDKKDRLRSYGVTSIHIEQKDLSRFYEAFAASIVNTQKSDRMSETEKREVLKGIVRELVAELFTDTVCGLNTGLRLNKHCKDIVMAYLASARSASGWQEKINTVTSGSEDFYARSTNTMVAATLIGIGLGMSAKSIDALAVAGLLHGIGLARIPQEIVRKPLNQLSQQELEIYKTHPQRALEILREKKVVLPELTYKVILQQAERTDGQGYPSQLKGAQIAAESQVLHLTIILMEKAKCQEKFATFKTVFDDYRKEYSANPSNRPIGQELFMQVAELFTAGPLPLAEDCPSMSKRVG